MNLKQYDYDRYLCSLFADAENQKKLITLYSFNLEISKIYDVVSEPMLGMIRLQWWREAIDEIYSDKKPRDHEIVQDLEDLIKTNSLSKDLFLQIINAREQDFEDPPKNMKALEQYAKGTSSTLLFIALELFENEDDDIKKVVEHIGIAWAITGILRSAYLNMPKGKFLFPADLMKKAGISKDNFGSKKFLEGSKEVVKELVLCAQSHVSEARKSAKDIDRKTIKKSLPVLLLVSLADKYLKQIEKANYDVFTRTFKNTGPATILRLVINSLRNRF